MSTPASDARQVFLDVLEVADPAARQRLVSERCTGDPGLQARVEELLRAAAQAGGILDQPLEQLVPTDIAPPISETVGTVIGPYKLMEQIGEGGFGLVFVAEQQQPVRRKVALKIIRPGMNTSEVIARFKAERQALALMDHPNIAKVLDAGTTQSGLPYFVMELVRGVPITHYCDRNLLTPYERLDLFIAVCRAVQHAHQKGIIHRDIKPSNVLVTLHDGVPVVKVIDFGVAKALHQPLTDKTIYTRFAQMIGTPLYASPEQAEMTGLDIDTRSDIYSLGVLLYELLTGTTPVSRERLATLAYEELVRIIREEEPPRPSTRLTQSSDSLAFLAAQRKTEPLKLSRLIRGDLDWITMKALEKDRTRRYESASGFAADVQRYLDNEPVEACPPSTAYRLRKFARKHRGPVIAGGVIAALLIIGIAGTTWGMLRAKQAEETATNAEEQALHDRDEKVAALAQVTEERNAKDAALVQVKEERDRAEKHLLDGLIAPLGYPVQVLYYSAKDDDPAEVEQRSIVTMSAIGDSRLKLRVLESAFSDPEAALRIAHRADHVIQACVGLSRERYASADLLLGKNQRDQSADPRTRIAACWLALKLGSSDLPALKEAVAWLGDPQNHHDQQFEKFLRDLFEYATPDQERVISGVVPGTFVAEFAQGRVPLTSPWSDSTGMWDDAELASVFQRMSSHDATAMHGLLRQTLADEDSDRSEALRVLKALAAQLTPNEAAESISQLVKLIESTENVLGDKLDFLTNAVAVLGSLSFQVDTAAMGPIHSVYRDLLQRPPEHSTGWVVETIAEQVVRMRPRLTDEQTLDYWTRLLAASTSDAEIVNGFVLERALAEIGRQASDNRIAKLADAVIAHLAGSPITRGEEVGIVAIESIAPRLDAERAAKGWDVVPAKMSNFDGSSEECLESLILRMLPEACDERLRERIDQLKHGLFLIAPELWTELRILCIGANDQTKAEAANAVLMYLEASASPDRDAAALQALTALARDLDESRLQRCWTLLAPTSEGINMTHEYMAILSALASRGNPDKVAIVADTFIEVLESTRIWGARKVACEGIAAIGPFLDEALVSTVWDSWVNDSYRTNNLYYWDEYRRPVFDAIATRMIELDLAIAKSKLEALLMSSRETDEIVLAARHLASVAKRLRAEERVAVATKLMRCLVIDWDNDVATSFAEILATCDVHETSELKLSAMTVALDWSSRGLVVSHAFMRALSPFRNIDGPQLAKSLSHPGATEDVRDSLLQAFEELVLHNGRRVFPDPDSDGDHEAQSTKSANPPPERTFHTLHDAALWIQTNWPDFDLGTNCPATWRP